MAAPWAIPGTTGLRVGMQHVPFPAASGANEPSRRDAAPETTSV
ncbi:hypothetical protein OH687_37945 [Burkholderia anthina]|nr:hypothetical protein OH687_37945 [Burkholderia anthina]